MFKIQEYIIKNSNLLSVRNQNVLERIIKSGEIYSLDKRTLTNFKLLKSLKGVGAKSSKELAVFFNNYFKSQVIDSDLINRIDTLIIKTHVFEHHMLTKKHKELLIRLFEDFKYRYSDYNDLQKHSLLIALKSKLKTNSSKIKDFLEDTFDESKYRQRIDIIEFIEYFELTQHELSERSQNRLVEICQSLRNGSFHPLNLVKHETFTTIKGLGKKSTHELYDFFNSKLGNYLRIESKQDFTILSLANRLNISQIELAKFIQESSIDFRYEIPYLSLLNFYLKQSLSKRDYLLILTDFHSVDYKKKGGLKSVSSKLNITRERVRQIRNQLFSSLEKKLENFNKILNDSEIKHRKYLNNQEALLKVDFLRLEENLALPDNIIFKSLSVLYPDYILLEEDNKIGKYDFLIKKEIFEEIRIDRILSTIDNLNRSKIDSDLKISIRGLIYKHLKHGNNFTLVDKALPIIKDLLFIRDNLVSNSKNEILLKRNTKKKIIEYIYEIIEEEGTPMHVNNITLILNEYFPDKPKKSENVRSQCINNPHLLINTEWSTYGLKKWEKKSNIKGGTIIEIIIEFLNKSENPRHIYFISKYVKKYRATNERSIEGLIKSDKLNRFKVYHSGFYGLKGLHNDEYYTLIKRIPGLWFNQLKKKMEYIDSQETRYNDIILWGTSNHDTTKEHYEAFINRRIDKGDLILNKNTLYLKK